MLYFYVALILLCETGCMSSLKEYAQSSLIRYFLLGMLLYVAICFLLVQTFAFEGIGMVNVIWSAFSVVFIAAAGAIEFRERITRTEIIGILFTLSGIVILRYEG